MYFIKDGTLINLERNSIEPYEHYIERVNFICSQHPKNKQEFNKAETFSRIYVNKRFLNAKYSVDAEAELETMTENLFKS